MDGMRLENQPTSDSETFILFIICKGNIASCDFVEKPEIATTIQLDAAVKNMSNGS